MILISQVLRLAGDLVADQAGDASAAPTSTPAAVMRRVDCACIREHERRAQALVRAYRRLCPSARLVNTAVHTANLPGNGPSTCPEEVPCQLRGKARCKKAALRLVSARALVTSAGEALNA